MECKDLVSGFEAANAGTKPISGIARPAPGPLRRRGRPRRRKSGPRLCPQRSRPGRGGDGADVHHGANHGHPLCTDLPSLVARTAEVFFCKF